MTLFDIAPEPGHVPEVRTAVLSDDRCYRYSLSRRWADGPECVFVMLNPSRANATEDDRTIRRCRGFAKTWGYAGFSVVNLYAWVSTDPDVLWSVEDPVGPENNQFLASYAIRAKHDGAPIVGGWGVNARPDRVEQVLRLAGMDRLECLGVTKAGAPRHPLYRRADTPREPWPLIA